MLSGGVSLRKAAELPTAWSAGMPQPMSCSVTPLPPATVAAADVEMAAALVAAVAAFCTAVVTACAADVVTTLPAPLDTAVVDAEPPQVASPIPARP